MNHQKFDGDFNYKYCITGKNSVIQQPVFATITLWKPNNRLSNLRCLHFLEKFFMQITIKPLKIQNRNKKTRNYIRYSFELNKNYDILHILSSKMPEPEILLVNQVYIIIYNFYKFRIEIPINITDHYTLMKIAQILPPTWHII